MSSHAVLRPIKRLFNCKIGHTGTLDPMATGMLVCAIGEARKFIQFTQSRSHKCYLATIQLGLCTDTSDITGTTVEQRAVPDLSTDQISQLIQDRFIGKQQQTPPIYSALKYQGKPYYYYARRNESIPIQSRDVTIFSIDHIHYDPKLHQIRFQTLVSAGTYIRSLAVDLASALGTVGCLSDLDRLYAEPWQNEHLYSLDQIRAHEQPEQLLLPIDRALPHCPRISLSSECIKKLKHGQTIPIDQCDQPLSLNTHYIATNASQQFEGMIERRDDVLKSLRMLSGE